MHLRCRRLGTDYYYERVGNRLMSQQELFIRTEKYLGAAALIMPLGGQNRGNLGGDAIRRGARAAALGRVVYPPLPRQAKKRQKTLKANKRIFQLIHGTDHGTLK